MRKLIVSVNITLDGFMAGPDGSLDWHFHYWDNETGEALNRQLSLADTILLGCNTYRAMASYWPRKAIDGTGPREDHFFIAIMNSYKKVVVSRTLQTAVWNNSEIIKDLATLQAFKTTAGKDIVLLGSSKLVASLFPTGLVDEYHIWLHPIAIGAGIPFFNTAGAQRFCIARHDVFKNGIVRLVSRP